MSGPYTPADTLRLAKRQDNPRRSYLLVNPLQAKHMPVSPKAALAMMEALGLRLAAAFPGTGLVIGFAETATAIAAMAAAAFPDCLYVHTTREALHGPALHFREEHSHAVLQRLSTIGLREALSSAKGLLLVDDEISTGKTLRNIVLQLRASFPALEGRPVSAAAILDRLSEEDTAHLHAAGIHVESLVKLPPIGGLEALLALETHPPGEICGDPTPSCEIRRFPLPNPRYALPARSYLGACGEAARAAAAHIAPALRQDGETLVLGTEECMLPALLLGRTLEEQGHSVRCHATTRSPIALRDAEDYPIRTGFRMESFYELGRTAYLYNLRPYDTVIVLTDATIETAALSQLTRALGYSGCRRLFFLHGGAQSEGGPNA